jgi:hypothetical protein
MEELRKLAAEVVGRDALEERFGHPRLSAVDIVLLHKMAAADPELLAIAGSLSKYEELGGTYETKESAPNLPVDVLGSGMRNAAGRALGAAIAKPAVTGQGLGALAGGVGGLAHGLQKDEQGQRHVLRGIGHGAVGALGGSVAGSLAGMGVGVARNVDALQHGLAGRYADALRTVR